MPGQFALEDATSQTHRRLVLGVVSDPLIFAQVHMHWTPFNLCKDKSLQNHRSCGWTKPARSLTCSAMDSPSPCSFLCPSASFCPRHRRLTSSRFIGCSSLTCRARHTVRSFVNNRSRSDAKLRMFHQFVYLALELLPF